MKINIKKALTAGAVASLISFGLVGCGSTAPETLSTGSDSGAHHVEHLTLVNGWAKAAEGMSGVFGTLTNPTGEDITLVSAETDVAGVTELHETTMIGGSMKMQEKPEGFTIPAGGFFELKPGEDHIMLMQLKRALLPGEVLPITLKFSNGESVTLELEIRDFSGAIEEYAPGDHDEHHGGLGDHEESHG